MATQVPGPSAQVPTHKLVRQQPGGSDEDTIGWAWWAGTREFTIPWEERATVRLRVRGLRLPAPDDPAPATGRMLGVCACAALLSIVGLLVAVRAVTLLLAGGAPPWYGPVIVIGGLAGIALTGAAFLAVHHTRLPWVLLSGAAVPLVVTVLATTAA